MVATTDPSGIFSLNDVFVRLIDVGGFFDESLIGFN